MLTGSVLRKEKKERKRKEKKAKYTETTEQRTLTFDEKMLNLRVTFFFSFPFSSRRLNDSKLNDDR